MTTTTHKRSTHIDAPVETVFAYVEDPHHFFAAMAPMSGDRSHFTDVTMTPEGVGDVHLRAGPDGHHHPDLGVRVLDEGPAGGKGRRRLAWNGDRDIDAILAFYKREIEA